MLPHAARPLTEALITFLDGLLRILRRSSAWVCFDGKQRQELLCGDSVRVRMSPNPVPTIDHLEQTSDWFDSLEVGCLIVHLLPALPLRQRCAATHASMVLHPARKCLHLLPLWH